MRRKRWIMACLVLLLLAGCGQAPAPRTTEPSAPPAAQEPYPLPSVPRDPTQTPKPTRVRPTALPSRTPVQPTPYAPAEALPDSFPTLVYAVQRPGQPMQPTQLWRLRYKEGTLREELWIDLAREAARDENDPRQQGLGYYWVQHVIPSPDDRYVALVLRATEGLVAHTLIVDREGELYLPIISPTNEGVGLLAWTPDGERIVAGDSVGNIQGTIRLEGMDFVELVELPRDYLDGVLDVVVSPDGGTIIFSRIPTNDMWWGTMGIDGSDLAPLPLPEGTQPGGYIRNLALSPSGRSCAFIVEPYVTTLGGGRLWIMEATGANPRPLGPANTYDHSPAWSPDGRTIAFSRWDDPNSPWDNPASQQLSTNPSRLVSSLWLIDVESGQERLLLSSEGRFAQWSPRWLPDGSGLVFLSERGGKVDAWFIRADGSGLQQLTRQGGLTGEIALLNR